MSLKRILSFMLIISLLLTSNSYASSLNNQKNKLSKEIKNTQQKLNQTKNEKKTVKNQIEELENNIAKVTDELDDLDHQLAEEQKKLRQAEVKLSNALAAKEDQKTKLKARIRYMYETPKTTYIEMILKSKNFNQMYNRSYYISQIVDRDKVLVEQLTCSVEQIEISKNEIERAKLSVQLLKTNQLNKKHALEQTKTKKGAVLMNLTAEEKEYLDELAQLEAESKAIERKLQEELKNSTKKYVGGKFAWPVLGYTRVSSSYGYRTHPISKVRKFHTGIDIPAPTGTTIVAAGDGTVLSASYMSGYGYTVIINHGSGIATLYGHNSSLSVKKGDEVKRGQEIAKAGSTGYSTGPHCHFEIRINGSTIDPMSYFK